MRLMAGIRSRRPMARVLFPARDLTKQRHLPGHFARRGRAKFPAYFVRVSPQLNLVRHILKVFTRTPSADTVRPVTDEKDQGNQLWEGSLMRLRACMLAIAVVVPLFGPSRRPRRRLAPPPPPAEAAPPPAAPRSSRRPLHRRPPSLRHHAPPPAPAAAPAGPSPKFTFGGLVDTYWMYYFNPGDGAPSIDAADCPGVRQQLEQHQRWRSPSCR